MQSIEDVDGYVREEPCRTSVEKEHVLVALRVEVAGRPGILLLDPGYHIARAITVMSDSLYPHTGEIYLLFYFQVVNHFNLILICKKMGKCTNYIKRIKNE